MINAVVLVGRLTKTPELKFTNSNIAFTNFTLAVNRQFKDDKGETQADFINCIVWRVQAENLCKYQTKGNLIGVQGRIQTRTYEDDNGTKYITEVVADSIQFLESKKDDNYPKTNEEIDYTYRQNEYERKTTAKGELEDKPKVNDESSLPF